jgi:hypothetical protein
MRDNMEIDFKMTGREGTDWIDLVQDRDRWRALSFITCGLADKCNKDQLKKYPPEDGLIKEAETCSSE